MSDFVYPPRNLGGESDHWGRIVEQRQDQQDRSIDSIRQTLENLGRASSGTLGSLGDQQKGLAAQVADLVGRVSYAWPNTGTQAIYSGSGTWTNQNLGPSRNFTLQEPRSVQISVIANSWLAATTGTSGSSSASIYMSFSVDGSIVSNTVARYGNAFGGSSGSNTSNQTNTMITARGLLRLPAGIHTIQPITTSAVITNSGTGAGSITVESVSIFVDVLQTVD